MWRRIKVAGATKLSVFQDKILAPALGWTRNYHGYIFIDASDGSQYGAKGGSVRFSYPFSFLSINNTFVSTLT
jgi:hypothetical protein